MGKKGGMTTIPMILPIENIFGGHFLQDQLKMLQREQQLRKDAQTALTPDFWEIQRIAGKEDGYRRLEFSWAQRHLAVQLHSNPKYRVAFHSKQEWKDMKTEIECDWKPFTRRCRRLSRRPFNSASEL